MRGVLGHHDIVDEGDGGGGGGWRGMRGMMVMVMWWWCLNLGP